MVDHHLPHDLIARNWTEVTHFDANPRNVFFHDFPIVCLEIPKLWMPQIHEHPIFIQLCFTIDPTRHQRLKETAMRGVPLFPNADVGDRLLLVGQPSLSASCGPLNLLEFGKHWEVWGLTSTNWKFDFRKIRQPQSELTCHWISPPQRALVPRAHSQPCKSSMSCCCVSNSLAALHDRLAFAGFTGNPTCYHKNMRDFESFPWNPTTNRIQIPWIFEPS